MKLAFTKNFVKDYRKLPQEIQNTVDKQLKIFPENPNHPSLNLKKMQDPRGIWECRVTYSCRLTFQIKDDTYIFRKVGTHDTLKNP
jgi:mRNA-degrading endonuclease RelE of RelBE toxin-antitoxin system